MSMLLDLNDRGLMIESGGPKLAIADGAPPGG